MTDHDRSTDIEKLSPVAQQLAREVLAHHLKHNLCLSEEGDRKAAETASGNIVAAFVALEAGGQQGVRVVSNGYASEVAKRNLASAQLALAEARLELEKEIEDRFAGGVV